MSRRGSHYFMWFIVFGLIAGLVSFLGSQTIDSEAIWLLAAGVLGMLIANQRLNDGKLARFYDFIIGVIFMLAGVVALALHVPQLNVGSFTNSLGAVITGSGESAHLLGLSLALFPAIVHLLLGFTSFRHGLDNK